MIPTIRTSELKRALNCGASIVLRPKVRSRQGDDGHEGAMLHYLIARRAIDELGAEGPEELAAPDVPAGYRLPAFSMWIVGWAIRHIRETVPDDWTLMVEVGLAYRYERWIQSGHIDLLAISPDGKSVIIIDWKTGRKIVDPASENEQGNGYLALVKRAWAEIQNAMVQIVQFYADEEAGFDRVSTVVVGPEIVNGVVSALDNRMGAQLDRQDELHTGPWCDYCIGPSCPALRAEMEELESMKMTLTPEALAATGPEPDDLTLSKFVEIGRRLATPIDDAIAMAKDRIKRNGSLPCADGGSYVLRPHGGQYSLKDGVQPYTYYRRAKDLLESEERFSTTVKISMSRLIDEIAEERGINKGGAAPVTAKGVVDATLKPLLDQAVNEWLVKI